MRELKLKNGITFWTEDTGPDGDDDLLVTIKDDGNKVGAIKWLNAGLFENPTDRFNDIPVGSIFEKFGWYAVKTSDGWKLLHSDDSALLITESEARSFVNDTSTTKL